MTKFRFGVSELSVHYYRYRNHTEKIMKCPLCRERKEYEVDFVLHWHMLDHIREEFIPPTFCKHPCLFRLNLLLASANKKLTEDCQYFYVRLSRLGILLLRSTNEPVAVNSYVLM